MEILRPPAQVAALQVQLSRVALVSDPDMPWYPEEATRYMNVHLGDPEGRNIGAVGLDYLYQKRIVRPHIDLAVRGQGIGTEIYSAIPFIPLPGGQDAIEAGFKVRSTGQNFAANRFWQSLVRRGMARSLDAAGHFELLETVQPPERLEITETGMLPTFAAED